VVRLYLVHYRCLICGAGIIDNLYRAVLRTCFGTATAFLLSGHARLDRNGFHMAISVIVQAVENCRLPRLRSATAVQALDPFYNAKGHNLVDCVLKAGITQGLQDVFACIRILYLHVVILLVVENRGYLWIE
jgi:hypothetical protein